MKNLKKIAKIDLKAIMDFKKGFSILYSNNKNKKIINSIYFSKKNFCENKDKKDKKDLKEDKKEELDNEKNKNKEEKNSSNDENKDNKNNNNKQKFTEEEEKLIDAIIQAFHNFEYLKFFILSGCLFPFTVLFYFLLKEKKVKMISTEELNKLISQFTVKELLFEKQGEIWTIYVRLKDGNIEHKLSIDNKNSFLHKLEKEQESLNINENDFVKIKYIPYKSNSNQSTLFLYLSILIFLGSFYKFNGVLRFFESKKINLKKLLDIKILIESNKRLKNSPVKNDKNKKVDKDNGGIDMFKMFNVGKINAREFGVEEKIDIRFKDVAGMASAKQEITEFVDFLKNPEKYSKLGAKIPRGALLVGPPGTGKTLLAKAVAGEAEVPFIAISGSEFVEMYVGVGASRVRDLFKKAKSKSPSIIFIDEIDAVGKKRGGSFYRNDERDSTLNQLLVEMDGFGTDSNVIVLAATNRPEILDKALLRPGRFDRQVEVNLPDKDERVEVLKIYLKKVKLNSSISMEEYAQRLSTLTPGYSGADLSNLVNEAAILAARENKKFIDLSEFEKASERVLAGLETKKTLSKEERKTVAYHEAGHAIIGWFLKNCNPIVKITIVPRSKGALGFTQYLPDENVLMTKQQLIDSICMTLGGRMAEEFFFKKITSGASDDLQKVTSMAKSMVTKYGMSSLGYRVFNVENDTFQKQYSEDTDKLIDQEVNKIINECAVRTREMIQKYKDHIITIAETLLKKETVDILDIINLIGERPFGLPKSMESYVKEIKERKDKKELELGLSKESLI